MTRAKDVRAYLEQLEKSKEGKPEQVREGLEIYVDLWEKAIGRGIVSERDTVDAALSKIEAVGG